MLHAEPWAGILDLVYSAAADREQWSSVMQAIARSLHAPGGILYGKSVRSASTSEVFFEHNGGLDETCNAAYKARHVAGVWTVAMYRKPIGHVVLSDEICPLAELRRTDFYDEVLKPQDVGHSAMIALAGEASFRVAFNVCRDTRRGPFDENERRNLALLVPHLRRSLLLGFRLEGYQELMRAQHHILDRLNIGIVLLDRNQRAVFVNRKAEALAETHGTLRISSDGVSTTSPPATSRLHRHVRAVAAGQPVAAMSLPSLDRSGSLSLVVTSLSRSDRSVLFDAGMRQASVLLFLIDPADDAQIPAASLVEAFGLTVGEARVAALLASGRTIQEGSMRLGLSQNTIKTHLRSVYAKLGVTRQAELAARVAMFRIVSMP